MSEVGSYINSDIWHLTSDIWQIMIIKKSELIDGKNIQITGSKSISNRLLILGKLFGNIDLLNLSNSQDTTLLKKALESDS